MRQIGRKCRAFLFYLFTDCYFLHASSEAIQRREGDLRRYLPDARNSRLFWVLMENFKGRIGLQEAIPDGGEALELGFLRDRFHGSKSLPSLPFCSSYVRRSALVQEWAWNIVRALYYRFDDCGIPIGLDLATLIAAVPYVYLTRHIITVNMTDCLHNLSAHAKSSYQGFPVNFSEYKEWNWSAESFRAAFADTLEQTGVTKKIMERFLKLDLEYNLVMHGLHLLVNPGMLPWATDFEGRLIQKFNEHAHSNVLAELKSTLEVGRSINDNPSLRNFSSGCLELLKFIEHAEPLMANIHGKSLKLEDGPDASHDLGETVGIVQDSDTYVSTRFYVGAFADPGSKGKYTAAEPDIIDYTGACDIHLDGIFGESSRLLKKKWRHIKNRLHETCMPDYLKSSNELDLPKRVADYGKSAERPKAKRQRQAPRLRITV